MFNLRRLLALFILAAVISLVVVVWRQTKQLAPEELLEALPSQIDLSLDALHYTQNEDGQRSWTLDADRAEYQRDQSQAVLEGVQVQFFNLDEVGDIHLQAEHGLLQQKIGVIEVWGQVVVTTARGEQLFTERLHYNNQLRQLSTAQPIRLLTPQVEMTGTGLLVELDNGRLQVERDVWMLLLPAEGDKKHE